MTYSNVPPRPGAFLVLPETSFIELALASQLTGISEDGLASCLFSEPGEVPPIRSVVIDGRELVALADVLPCAARRPSGTIGRADR